MESSQELESPGQRWVCHACVDEVYLSSEIASSNTRKLCSYCEEIRPAISTEDLADRIEAAFSEHYHRTSESPTAFEQALLSDPEIAFDWERHGQPVVFAIADAAGISEDIACGQEPNGARDESQTNAHGTVEST